MKLCLIMIGRFEEKNGCYYADKKNINAITRYLKYFEKIYVVARRTNKNSGLYPRQKVDCMNGRISFHLYDELNSGLKTIKYFWEFRSRITEVINKSDIVLSWAEPKTSIIAKIIQGYKKPYIIYVGGCTKDTLLSTKSVLKKIAGVLIFYLNKKAIYNADYVHYVTDKELQKRYPTKGESIGATYANIITDIEEIDKQTRLSRYNAPLNKVTIGLIGYLNEVKGIDTAIKALAVLDNRFSLKILGGGNKERYIQLARELAVDDRVSFEGTVEPGLPVLNWLDTIDIYVQPSRTEGLPRATIEALSRGCPVVSSNAMGLVELVDEEWRHKPGDWNNMARLIEKLAKSPEELTRLSKRNFQVAQKYNRVVLDNHIDGFFKMIINR